MRRLFALIERSRYLQKANKRASFSLVRQLAANTRQSSESKLVGGIIGLRVDSNSSDPDHRLQEKLVSLLRGGSRKRGGDLHCACLDNAGSFCDERNAE